MNKEIERVYPGKGSRESNTPCKADTGMVRDKWHLEECNISLYPCGNSSSLLEN